MKKHAIDFDQVVRDHKGRPIIDTPEVKDADGNVTTPAVELTLGSLCFASMHRYLEEDKTRTSPTAVMTAYTFANRVAGGVVDLTIDEITRLRDRVAKAGWPLSVAGPGLMLLDTATAPKPEAGSSGEEPAAA